MFTYCRGFRPDDVLHRGTRREPADRAAGAETICVLDLFFADRFLGRRRRRRSAGRARRRDGARRAFGRSRSGGTSLITIRSCSAAVLDSPPRSPRRSSGRAFPAFLRSDAEHPRAILPLWRSSPSPSLGESLFRRENAALPGVRGRLSRWIKEAVIMGLTVHLGLWPLLVYYFHRLSLAGFVANWTVFPLSGIIHAVVGSAVGIWGGFGAAAPFRRFLVAGIRLGGAYDAGSSSSAWGLFRAVGGLGPLRRRLGGCRYCITGILFGILFMIRRRKIYGQLRPPPKHVVFCL